MVNKNDTIENFTKYVIKIRNDVFLDLAQNAKGSLRYVMTNLNKNYNIKEYKVIKNYNTGRYEIYFETLENNDQITFEKFINNYLKPINDRAGMKFRVDYIEKTDKKPENVKDNYDGIIPKSFNIDKINFTLQLLIILIFGYYALQYIDIFISD